MLPALLTYLSYSNSVWNVKERVRPVLVTELLNPTVPDPRAGADRVIVPAAPEAPGVTETIVVPAGIGLASVSATLPAVAVAAVESVMLPAVVAVAGVTAVIVVPTGIPAPLTPTPLASSKVLVTPDTVVLPLVTFPVKPI